jgi:hypothetical protein
MTDLCVEPDEIPQVLGSYALATILKIPENCQHEHKNKDLPQM